MTQKYKGDAQELKFELAGMPVTDFIDESLDDFFEGSYDCAAFLLSLYDQGLMPYSQRIKREVFVSFIRKALENVPFIGNFESYLFILREIFGQESVIFFEVIAPGKLSISVDASSDLVFEALARELSGGSYSFFTIGTSDLDDIVFKAIAGIETEAELELLFSEVIPGGIVPTVSLDFFLKSTFYGEDSGEFDMVTSFNDTIVFIEVSGG